MLALRCEFSKGGDFVEEFNSDNSKLEKQKIIILYKL